jgi:sugar phosphate isomerase/epimerase
MNMKETALALQLYSVRGECAKDLPATLRAVRGLGYRAVEPWGYDGGKVEWMGRPARDLRAMLDDNGLACCGMHLSTAALLGDNLQRTVELNRELGNRFLIIAADKERMSCEAGIGELAGILTEAAAKLKPLGMFTGYHAHPFDFVRFGGRTAWDILFSGTPSEVVMQMDIGNCANGGGDPIAILKKFPARARSVHLKDYGGPAGSALGEGKADWAEILRLCDVVHKTEWYVVEEGGQDGLGFEICRRSLENLRRMEK